MLVPGLGAEQASGAMSDVVKKGVLDVKRKNLIVASSYKKRFIVLKNSSCAWGKVVEIWETENSGKDPERQPLGDSWSVQDKPSTNSKRYAFQLLIREGVAFTFGCTSFMEREEWTKAFNVFKKMAPPIGGRTTPTDNDFFVKLISCPSGPEFSHPPGQYILSVKTNAICLHWRTGAIAHQWPHKYVQELSIRSWNIVLRVSRIGSGPSNTVEFEFQATRATAIAILKCWNIILMESIVGSSKDPEQMSYIGKLLSAEASETTSKKLKSFRNRSQSTKARQIPQSKSGSFSNSHSATISRHPSAPGGKLFSDASARKLTSEFSVNGSLGLSKQSTPPPLPPRPEHYGLSSDEDNPDYAYIENSEIEGPKKASTSSKKTESKEGGADYAYIENSEIEGPKKASMSSKKTESKEGGEKVASPSVDEQLLEILRSMKQEKKEKRKKEAEKKRRSVTVAYPPTHSQRPALSLGPQIPFAPADPEDYLEPLVARFQASRPKSTGDYETPVPIHKRSCSEPDTSMPYPHKCLSQPLLCLSQKTPPKLSPNDDS